MSYEIIYTIFTIKKENQYIPFIVIGSNNCFEHSGRRERNLYKANSFFKNNKGTFSTLEELKQNFNTELINKEIENGSIQGRYKTSKSILNQFCKKIIDYTELSLRPELTTLYYLKISEDQKKQVLKAFNELSIKTVLTDKETEQYQKELLNKLNTETATALKSYLSGRLFFYPYAFNEYSINNALEKYKVKRTKKVITQETALNLLSSETAFKISSELKEEDFIKVLRERFLNKRVVLKASYGVMQGRIKPVRDDKIGFFQGNSRKRFNYLSLLNGVYAGIKPVALIEY